MPIHDHLAPGADIKIFFARIRFSSHDQLRQFVSGPQIVIYVALPRIAAQHGSPHSLARALSALPAGAADSKPAAMALTRGGVESSAR